MGCNAPRKIYNRQLMPEQAYDHDNDGYKEHNKGYAVHPMHQLNVYVPGCARVTLAQVEICEHLLPYTLFH